MTRSTTGQMTLVLHLSPRPVRLCSMSCCRMKDFDMLPDIRKQSNVAVLMLTARGDDFDRILGLDPARATLSRNRSTLASWSRPSRQFCDGPAGRATLSPTVQQSYGRKTKIGVEMECN